MADIGLAMQRALDKTETMKARARAVEQLQPTGNLEEVSVLSPAEDGIDIDRQLEQLGMRSAVDDELAKLKAELETGSEAADTVTPQQSLGSAQATSPKEQRDRR